ncbi:hypothetical protein LCGC14_2209480 [marine sediment metagenome]|uniref:Uncharacterized protein n=1 Tax=marine sediment metagenome TaxID=412755 RepID=A0A0F9DE52_9ZZZZ
MATKDSDLDRIQLAEAIGGPIWEAYIDPGKHPECVDLPDPENDANDDYAVLEWMREHHRAELRRACNDLGKSYAWNYQIGDYARAALKMIRSIASED